MIRAVLMVAKNSGGKDGRAVMMVRVVLRYTLAVSSLKAK